MNKYPSYIQPPEFAITIDGPAGGGKWTLGSGLARTYNLLQIDTGIFYRVLTLKVLTMLSKSSSGVEFTELDIQGALESTIAQKENNNIVIYTKDYSDNLLERPLVYTWSFKDGLDEVGSRWLSIGEKTLTIRSPEVNELIARVANKVEARFFADNQARILASGKRIVIDGRDTGGTVFPNAQVKLWVTASSRIRAERQVAMQKVMGRTLSIEEVEQSITERDYRDATRSISPLRKPAWAFEIDTSDKTPNEVLEIAKQIVDSRIPRT